MSLRLASWAKPEPIHKASRRTVALLIAWSLTAVAEIIKQLHAIGFGPDANHSSFGKGFVVPLDGFLPIERHGEMIAAEVHPQGVPLVGGDLHVRSFLLCPLAFDRVINGHVVFERVGARYVIIVGVLGSPDDAASLVFLAGDRLELHFNEAVFEARAVLQADRVCGFTG